MQLVLKASAALKPLPFVRDAHVRMSAINAVRVFVSSEGTRLVHTKPYRVVELHFWYLSPEGIGFPQTKTWFVTDERELPDVAAGKAEAPSLKRRKVCCAVEAEMRTVSMRRKKGARAGEAGWIAWCSSTASMPTPWPRRG